MITKDELKITQKELDATKIERLPNRPNTGASIGGGALSATEMKRRYDAAPELISKKINALVDAIAGVDEEGKLTDKGIASLIMTGLGKGHSLTDLFRGLADGSAMQLVRAGIDAYTVKGYMLYLKGLIIDKFGRTEAEAWKIEIDKEIDVVEQESLDRFDAVDREVKLLKAAIEFIKDGTTTEEIDSIKELVSYVNEHGKTTAAMLGRISQNEKNTYAILMTVYILNLILNADDGRDHGRQNKKYIDQRKAYYEINNRMTESGCSRFLPQFCRERREQNLIERRRAVLSRVNISYVTYLTKYVGRKPPKDLSRDKRKAVKLANSLKPEDLTASMLLHEGKKEQDPRILGEDPTRRYIGELFMKICGAAVVTFVIGDIAGITANGPTLATVAAGVGKLVSYLVSGYFGYYTGYNNIALSVTDYMRQQTRVLHEFEAWYQENRDHLGGFAHIDMDAIPEGMDALTGEMLPPAPRKAGTAGEIGANEANAA